MIETLPNPAYVKGVALGLDGASSPSLRLDFGRSGNNPAFLALIHELDDASPEFHRWWLCQDVNGFGEGLKRIHHAQLGEIEFEHSALAVENAPDLRVIIYTPVAGKKRPDGATARCRIERTGFVCQNCVGTKLCRYQ
jgi:hypothetical protein